MNKEQGFILVVLAVSALLSLLVVLPFLQYILGALVVAYVLSPVNRWLVPRVGSRIAPLVAILGILIAVIVPVGYLTLVLIRDLVAISAGRSGLETAEIEATIRDVSGQRVDLTESVNAMGSELLNILFRDVSTIVSFGLQVTLGFALALFLVYYLLRDGDRFVAWIIDVAPAGDAVCSRLLRRIDNTTWGVIVGHLFVAVLQGVVGGLGLYVAGIPNAAFWTFAMVVLALLPLIGAFFVWAPAAIYLGAIGQVQAGLFLFVYGAVVVSMVDNFVRPVLIDREARLNPAVVLIGVFGGTYAIGVVGLFLGPLVLAVLAATVTAFDEEYDSLSETEQTDDNTANTARQAS